MGQPEPYMELLNDDSINGIPERREAIGKAIDDLINLLEQNQVQRKEIDARDEPLYTSLKKLDAAYARLSRGKRYTEKMKKSAIRRFWTAETHEWIERFLFEWARKQLQEGPKDVSDLYFARDTPLSLVDLINVMSHHPETFEEQKSSKPPQKYARRRTEWKLTTPTSRFGSTHLTRSWDIEIAVFKATGNRPLTHSERMHGMLEDAIVAFYAGKFTSVFHAFADLYWKDFARSFCYFRDLTEKLEAKIKAHAPAQSPSPSS